MAEEINEDWISDAIGEGSAKSDSPKYKYPVNKYNYNESIRLDDDDSLIKTRIFNLNEEQPASNKTVNMSKISCVPAKKNRQDSYEADLIPPLMPGRSTSNDSDSAPSQESIQKLNLSIITDRIKPFANPAKAKKQAPLQNGVLQKSYYMQPYEAVEDKHSNVKAVKFEEKSKSKMPSQPIRVESEQLITVILRSTSYFLEGNQHSIQIDSTSLQDMCNEFFRLEAFIPLFNYELFDGWMLSHNKFQFDQEAHKLFRIYLQRYTAYLNEHYPKQFQQVLNSLLEVQQGKNAKKTQNSTLTSLFSFDFYSLLDKIMKIVKSSKTQFLRDSLIAKARSLRQAYKYCEQGGEKMKHHLLRLQAMEETTWIDVGQIELLLSLQRTEEYCCKKIEESVEPKFKDIYSKYRDCMRLEKKKHLSSLSELML